MEIQATKVFERNYRSKKRIVVNQGGTRSSKTYSLAQLYVIRAMEQSGKLFTVCRKTLPALKATAMRDFFAVLQSMDMYDPKNHNKTEMTYILNNNEIEFISVDQPQKIRGRKRNYLWMNEANEFLHDDFRQLILRTIEQAFLDYNPSDEFHWIYDKVMPRDDCEFIHSTYLDNPFLDPETIKEIERLKELDDNYWRIYGLGEKGISETTIYSKWGYVDSLPEGEQVYGLDFGYNNPTALVKISVHDDNIYAHEELYQSKMTNQDLIEWLKMKEIRGYIYADCAEPQRIQEIKRAGFNIKPADKSKNSVKDGIDTIKRKGIFITKDSVNLLKEIKSYKWKEKNDQVLDEPIKMNDHLMDAMRYAAHTHLTRPKAKAYATKPAGL